MRTIRKIIIFFFLPWQGFLTFNSFNHLNNICLRFWFGNQRKMHKAFHFPNMFDLLKLFIKDKIVIAIQTTRNKPRLHFIYPLLHHLHERLKILIEINFEPSHSLTYIWTALYLMLLTYILCFYLLASSLLIMSLFRTIITTFFIKVYLFIGIRSQLIDTVEKFRSF